MKMLRGYRIHLAMALVLFMLALASALLVYKPGTGSTPAPTSTKMTPSRTCTVFLPADAQRLYLNLPVPEAGTYSIWSRVKMQKPSASLFMQIDDGCPSLIAPNAPAEAWTWTPSQSTVDGQTITLAAGSHRVTIVARQGIMDVDKVVAADPECTPINIGSNCTQHQLKIL